MTTRKKIAYTAIFSLTALGMGISMPQCPGQEAMQQQIEELKTKTTEQAKQIQLQTNQMQSLSRDMAQMKPLLGETAQTVLAQQKKITELEVALQEATKPKPAPAKGKPAPAKKKK